MSERSEVHHYAREKVRLAARAIGGRWAGSHDRLLEAKRCLTAVNPRDFPAGEMHDLYEEFFTAVILSEDDDINRMSVADAERWANNLRRLNQKVCSSASRG